MCHIFPLIFEIRRNMFYILCLDTVLAFWDRIMVRKYLCYTLYVDGFEHHPFVPHTYIIHFILLINKNLINMNMFI